MRDPHTDVEPRAWADVQHAHGCPVSQQGKEAIILGYREVYEAANNPEAFSSAVSRFLQIPNGLDGAEHSAFRTLLHRYLSAEALASHEAGFRAVAVDVVNACPDSVLAVNELGARYAVKAMMSWLGWPQSLETRLLEWVFKNNEATRSGELEKTAAVAEEFDEIIREAIALSPNDSVTQQLLADDSLGRDLEFREVVSILRNWTSGDLSSMAYCIAVILEFLHRQPSLQERLRQGVSDKEFSAIIDEILRQDSPFVSNRRVTTCPVSIGNEQLEAGQVVRLHWTGANRDPKAFNDPDAFDPYANASKNLVWGSGPHVCPGKTLSMMQLRAFLDVLLESRIISDADTDNGVRETFPVGGWAKLRVSFKRR